MEYKGGLFFMKCLRRERGFTLIEMLIVLFVISILMIITIPNITKNQSAIKSKGCEAFVQMVQGQVQAYEIDHNKWPTNVDELKNGNYLTQTSCPNGDVIQIDENGKVTSIANKE